MNSPKNFTVAIVGGGLVGLIFAIELAKANVQVDVFEASSAYGDIGAGIGIGPNAFRALEYMGITRDLEAVLEDKGPRMGLMGFIKGEDAHNVVYQYPSDKRTDQGYGVHRGSFLKALARLLPASVGQHFNKRCTSLTTTPDGRASVRFADGTDYVAGVVVGADGIKSAVRAHVLGADDTRLVDTMCDAYRAVVPMQRLLDAGVNPELLNPRIRCWMGNDKHIIMYPISNGTLFNIAAFATDYTRAMVPAGPQSSWATWVTPASRDDVLAAFSDFGEDALTILGCIDASNKWDVHGIYPSLDSYVGIAKDGAGKAEGKVNVALIGDAAHAMLPHLGAGAGTGIEDAFVLARLLAHPQTTRDNISDVLRAYDAVRVPRGAYIANASKAAGDVYEAHGPSGSSDAGRRKDLELQWEVVWEHDVNVDVEQAVGALVENGVFVK